MHTIPMAYKSGTLNSMGIVVPSGTQYPMQSYSSSLMVVNYLTMLRALHNLPSSPVLFGPVKHPKTHLIMLTLF